MRRVFEGIAPEEGEPYEAIGDGFWNDSGTGGGVVSGASSRPES